MTSPILQPVVVLVLWSLVMWAWLYATRIPAMNKAKIALDPNRTTADLTAQLPPQVRWKADNYNHLMEQPTLFYAVALTLAFVGEGSGLNAWLVQALANIIMVRFLIFMVGSLVLLALAIQAALAVF